MKVFDTMENKTFPTGMAVLVMGSIVDIIAVESVLGYSDKGTVRKLADELRIIRGHYSK